MRYGQRQTWHIGKHVVPEGVMNGPVLEVAPGKHQGKPSVSARVNKLTHDTWLTIVHGADRFVTICESHQPLLQSLTLQNPPRNAVPPKKKKPLGKPLSWRNTFYQADDRSTASRHHGGKRDYRGKRVNCWRKRYSARCDDDDGDASSRSPHV